MGNVWDLTSECERPSKSQPGKVEADGGWWMVEGRGSKSSNMQQRRPEGGGVRAVVLLFGRYLGDYWWMVTEAVI